MRPGDVLLVVWLAVLNVSLVVLFGFAASWVAFHIAGVDWSVGTGLAVGVMSLLWCDPPIKLTFKRG